jgi:hypothetical protein
MALRMKHVEAPSRNVRETLGRRAYKFHYESNEFGMVAACMRASVHQACAAMPGEIAQRMATSGN